VGAWFGDLARRAEAPVRPGALLRVARILRKQRSFDEALATYLTISRLPPSIVENVPSDLLARWLRCELLESLGRGDDLRREASVLLEDLRQRKWIVAGAVYEVHMADAARWSGQPLPATSGHMESFASAAADLRQEWQTRDRGTAVAHGRWLVPTDEGFGAAIWRTDPSRLVAFVALPSFVEREWLAAERPWLDSRGHLERCLEPPRQRH
jgi:hypothetical protein